MGSFHSHMVDEIIEKCSNMRITKEEEAIIALEGDQNETFRKDISLPIVGKAFSDRPFNFHAFKRTMNQIWSLSKVQFFVRLNMVIYGAVR